MKKLIMPKMAKYTIFEKQTLISSVIKYIPQILNSVTDISDKKTNNSPLCNFRKQSLFPDIKQKIFMKAFLFSFIDYRTHNSM